MDTDHLFPAAEGLSVRDRLHRIIDDLEIIIKQFGEVVTTPREDRGLAKDFSATDLAKLFKIKEEELEKTLEIAVQQAERQKIIDQLEQEVQKRDEYLLKIRNCLRESESLMTNAIYQANQKLKSIALANHQKISAEELIRYAHRISACNAVAAPMTWQQGDPQRPFPTDAEMRSGLLSRVGAGDFVQPHMAGVGIPQASGSVPSTPTLIPSGQGPSATGQPMHPFMPPPVPSEFSPLHRPFSPTAPGGIYQGSPGVPPGAMMPPRNMPAGWIAQRALTPPNVSPRALRLPPHPPQFQQHTPPHSHYMGGPMSPMSAGAAASIPQGPAMHPGMQHHSPLAQQALMQTTPPQQFQHQFGARGSPQMMPIIPPQQQQVRAQLPPQMPRQTSPGAVGRMIKQEAQHSDTVELLSSDSSSTSSSDSPG